MQATTNNAFVDLIDYKDIYEISTEYPYFIRNKQTGRISSIIYNKAGYELVRIDGYYAPLHKIIARQFIENDDPFHKKEVEHINKNKSDNHINNLRWITRSELLRKRKPVNRQPAEYLPDDNNHIESDHNVEIVVGERRVEIVVGKVHIEIDRESNMIKFVGVYGITEIGGDAFNSYDEIVRYARNL